MKLGRRILKDLLSVMQLMKERKLSCFKIVCFHNHTDLIKKILIKLCFIFYIYFTSPMFIHSNMNGERWGPYFYYYQNLKLFFCIFHALIG